ncbi:hypothetical protein ACQJBY_013534 [Aegilops geniculata]
MDDETTAATTWHVPHELVTQILPRLPVKSLVRFTCVCKTWHDTITGQSFQREHLSLQEPCVLIAPQIGGGTGLYRWEKSQGAATLVQAMDSFPAVETNRRHKLAHCDGLVLVVSMDDTVWVLNPATHHALSLPRSHVTPIAPYCPFLGAFGLGHDPRSNTYKVARIYYHSVDTRRTGGCRFTFRVEVFTIGRDQHWHQTAAPPPYPIEACRTATFFKGSLLWTIDESVMRVGGDVGVRGFPRFNLKDESFSVIPAPPGCPDLGYSTFNLAEMCGELYLAHEGPKEEGSFHSRSAWIWACNDVDGSNPPRWVRRHVIDVPHCIHLIATSKDGILFQEGSYNLMCSNSQSIEGVRHVATMHDLIYHHPDSSTYVNYPKEIVYSYDLIPYVPSMLPV